MAKTRFFYPHNVDDQLDLRITQLVDPSVEKTLSIRPDEIGAGAIRHAYSLPSHNWEKILVFFEIGVSSKDIGSLLQSGEDYSNAVNAMVSVRCAATKLRFSVPAKRKDDRWAGSVEIYKRQVRGSVALRPILYRAALPANKPRPGRANSFGAILGEGPTIQLVVDAGINHFKGGLDVRWEDFRGSEDNWRRSNDKDLYSISFEPDPIVWLNARYDMVQSLLHDEGVSGPSAVIREAIFSHLKNSIWTSLFRVAASSITRDPEDETVQIREGWEKTVIQTIIPYLYPQMDEDAGIEMLATALSNADEAASLETKLRSVIQNLSNSPIAISRVARVGERE